MTLSGLKERLKPFINRRFPPRVLLALEDRSITVMVRPGDGRPGPGHPVRSDLLRTVPIPRGVCVEGLPIQRAALGDLIGDLLLELGLLSPVAKVALPAAACAWRLVQWPFEEWPEEPEQALRQIDPDLGLPYALSQAYLQLVPLPGSPAAGLTSLLVSAPHQLVQAWIEVFDIAGLELERMEAAQICELRAVAPLLEAVESSELVALVEVQPAGGRLTLLKEGCPEYGRGVTGTVADLADELKRVVSFWRRRDPQVRSVRVLAFGPGVVRPEVAPALSLGPDWRVEVLDPLAEGWLAVDPGSLADGGDPDSVAVAGPTLVGLCGLAQVETLR